MNQLRLICVLLCSVAFAIQGTDMGTTFAYGTTLTVNNFYSSSNSEYIFIMQSDGNLVEYYAGGANWYAFIHPPQGPNTLMMIYSSSISSIGILGPTDLVTIAMPSWCIVGRRCIFAPTKLIMGKLLQPLWPLGFPRPQPQQVLCRSYPMGASICTMAARNNPMPSPRHKPVQHLFRH